MIEEKEVWKDIKGYEGKYQVSNLGNVKSLLKDRNGKIMKPRANKHGYYQVYLYSDSKTRKMYLVHRLAAQTFIENPDNLPLVNHKDENTSNNCVTNLEWCTNRYNTCYGNAISKAIETRILRNRKTAPKAILQYTKEGSLIKEFKSISDAGRELEIGFGSLWACLNKRYGHKTAGGYIWKYKEDVK